MSAPPVRVLELMGPPGSGKTTLAAELKDLPGCSVVKDHRATDLPVLLSGALRSWTMLTIDPPPGVSRTRWMAWVGRLAAADAVVKRRAADGARLVVLDQGPAYTLARLTPIRATRQGARWWEDRLRACAQMLDVLVLLEADRQTLAARVRSRDKRHPARDLQGVQADCFLAGEQHRFEALAGRLEDAGVDVARLDTAHMRIEDEISSLRLLLVPHRTGGS